MVCAFPVRRKCGTNNKVRGRKVSGDAVRKSRCEKTCVALQNKELWGNMLVIVCVM